MEAVAVIVAAAAGFAGGAAWYMGLGARWMAAAGVKAGADGRPEGRSPLPFVVAGVCMLLLAGLMRHMMASAGLDGPGTGITVGASIGAFAIAPWLAMNYAYARRPRALWLIDGGYAVVGPALIGLVLGLF